MRVIAIIQLVDLSGPVGNLIASLLFGIAEIELQPSKEHQAIGIALEKTRRLHWTPAGHNEGSASAGTDVDYLRSQGVTPKPHDLVHLSPLGWEYINLTGDYHWADDTLGPDQFRPLRTRSSEFAVAA